MLYDADVGCVAMGRFVVLAIDSATIPDPGLVGMAILWPSGRSHRLGMLTLLHYGYLPLETGKLFGGNQPAARGMILELEAPDVNVFCNFYAGTQVGRLLT